MSQLKQFSLIKIVWKFFQLIIDIKIYQLTSIFHLLNLAKMLNLIKKSTTKGAKLLDKFIKFWFELPKRLVDSTEFLLNPPSIRYFQIYINFLFKLEI